MEYGRMTDDITLLPSMTALQIAAWCAQHNVMPEMLNTGRRTLEDVFLELTGKADR